MMISFLSYNRWKVSELDWTWRFISIRIITVQGLAMVLPVLLDNVDCISRVLLYVV